PAPDLHGAPAGGLPPPDPAARRARARSPRLPPRGADPTRDARRQAALHAVSRRGRPDEGGRRPPGPADQGRPGPPPPPGAGGEAGPQAHLPGQPPVRRGAAGPQVAPPPPREAAARHAVRRLRLGPERLAVHAAAGVEPPGLLLKGAEL